MTTTICHASFQLNCLHQVVLFILKKKQEYSLMKVFDNISVGSEYPFMIEYGNARRWITPHLSC